MSDVPVNLAEVLALADALQEGRDHMQEPQDLPGRFGRVIKSLDRLLVLTSSEAVVGGGCGVAPRICRARHARCGHRARR